MRQLGWSSTEIRKRCLLPSTNAPWGNILQL